MAPTKLALALDWLPNAASHAGFYVAQAQGLYEKHGLDVTIISPHSGAHRCSSNGGCSAAVSCGCKHATCAHGLFAPSG